MKKVLVIAAHPDDEVLGIGGTVRKHVNQGDCVWCIILGEGMTSRNITDKAVLDELHNDTLVSAKVLGYEKVIFSNFPDNKFDSVPLLQVTQEIEKYIDLFKPEIVYTHHSGDLNIDHRITYEATVTATRPIGDYTVQEVYTFETPSSTEWNFAKQDVAFVPNVFNDISTTIKDKIKAMGCYTSELREYPHPRSLKALEIIAAKWGTVVGKEYVEALCLVRKTNY